MAKPAESAGGDTGDLKASFKLAHSHPMNVAFAVGGDGKAVVKLDKMLKPKALAKSLKTADPKIKNIRFGTVEIDKSDTTLAKFTMNKEVSGFQGKLIVALKGTGINKVEIGVGEEPDEGDVEADDEQEADGGGASAAPPAAAAPNGPPPGPPVGATPTPAAPAPPAPEAAGPDAGQLTQQLTALVKQMMAVIASNPAQKATLTQLATTAQASLKQGNLAQASAAIADLQKAVGSSGGAAAAPPSSADAAAIAKSRVAWVATRSKVESEIDKLKTEILKVYNGHGAAADIEKAFEQKVLPMMEKFDNTLSDKLDELGKATDPGGHSKLVDEAHQILDRYRQFLDTEPLIKSVDQNPFVPVAIEKTLTATLSALAKTIR